MPEDKQSCLYFLMLNEYRLTKVAVFVTGFREAAMNTGKLGIAQTANVLNTIEQIQTDLRQTFRADLRPRYSSAT